MNELIRKLSEQARKYASDYVADCKHYGYYMEHNEYELRFEEKFTELIILECIGCCEQVISDPVPESVDTWLNGGEQCIQEIKEHFGVEEK